MKLAALVTLAMKKLGYGAEDIAYQDNRTALMPELLDALNEAYLRAVIRLKPVKEEVVTLDEGCCFAVSGLTLKATRIRYVRWGKTLRELILPYDREMDSVYVASAPALSEVTVGYEFDPPPLSEDDDEPLLKPVFVHGALADYAAARHLEQEGKREQAASLYGAFERSLYLLQPVAGRFTHRYATWGEL